MDMACSEKFRKGRLELLRFFLQSCLGDEAYNNVLRAGAQGGAHVEKALGIDPKLEAGAAEMAEVIAAWPKIETSVRTGLMAIVRAHHGSVARKIK
jgi:hypothetical protein